VRSLGTVAVTCALVLGFIEAPFLHVHEFGGDEDHHASEQVHVHTPAGLSPVDGPAVRNPDPADDERTVNWFQAVQHAELFVYLAPEQVRIPEPVEQSEFLSPPPPVRGHDPPSCSQRPSRAPPVIPA
jgi:hypothetical protein